MIRAQDGLPTPSKFLTSIVVPVVSIGIGIALNWLASRRDTPDWGYLIPISLLFILLMFVVAPYIRWCWIALRVRRNAKVAAKLYRPQLANGVAQFLSRSSASQTNTAPHVLHILNKKDDYGGIDYAPECAHARTLVVWGQGVLQRLRSDEFQFAVVATDSMEFLRSYLSFIDCAGRRIDDTTIGGEPVEKELARILGEWNAAVDHLVTTTSHLYVLVGGVGEFTGVDYSESYFPIPERLSFTSKPSESPATENADQPDR